MPLPDDVGYTLLTCGILYVYDGCTAANSPEDAGALLQEPDGQGASQTACVPDPSRVVSLRMHTLHAAT